MESRAIVCCGLFSPPQLAHRYDQYDSVLGFDAGDSMILGEGPASSSCNVSVYTHVVTTNTKVPD